MGKYKENFPLLKLNFFVSAYKPKDLGKILLLPYKFKLFSLLDSFAKEKINLLANYMICSYPRNNYLINTALNLEVF